MGSEPDGIVAVKKARQISCNAKMNCTDQHDHSVKQRVHSWGFRQLQDCECCGSPKGVLDADLVEQRFILAFILQEKRQAEGNLCGIILVFYFGENEFYVLSIVIWRQVHLGSFCEIE